MGTTLVATRNAGANGAPPVGHHDRAAALAALRSESDPRRRPRATPPTPDDEGLPYVVEFTPRRGPQLLVTAVLLVCLASTGVVGWIAYHDRTQTVVASAAALATLTAFVWAVRAGSSPTRMTVTGGRLEIRRSGGRHVFDLTSPALSIEERGRAGDRGWKVVFVRRGLGPFVVDASMVDPHAVQPRAGVLPSEVLTRRGHSPQGLRGRAALRRFAPHAARRR